MCHSPGRHPSLYQKKGSKSIQAPLSSCFLLRPTLETVSVTKRRAFRQSMSRVFLEWPVWNTGQYKHSPAHHRQYHWKAKLLHNSQGFIGCHVDFRCSGVSVGRCVFVWLMVCVFSLWNQQEPQTAEHIRVSLPPPWAVLLDPAPAHFSLRPTERRLSFTCYHV